MVCVLALPRLVSAVPNFASVRALYTLTLFVSSALLFLVQPMVGKLVLPRFGGSPQVWNASLVFFQGALLLGYLYAHLSSRALGARRQPWLHLGVMGLAALALPVSLREWPWLVPGENPFGVLVTLAAAVGLPFLALSAGAPLLQRWYAATGARDSGDPYFLYSASNVGSMLALLAYPLVLEPLLPIRDQSRFWGFGYLVLVGLMAISAVALHRSPARADEVRREEEAEPVAWRTRLLWLALAAVPSSLLLGVTTYLTSNVTPVPLLWVVPLALYLLTFIIAFARKRPVGAGALARVLPLLATPLALVVILEATDPIVGLAVFHLVAFFVAALMCHIRLVDARPAAGQLTQFYLWMSLGGVIGGSFNAILAPILFRTLAEYPIALVAALLLRPPKEDGGRLRPLDLAFPVGIALLTAAAVWVVRSQEMAPGPASTLATIGIPAILCFLAVDRIPRFALGLGALFLASTLLQTTAPGAVVATERSFFGVHRVVRSPDGLLHQLMHGTTIHGKQRKDLPHIPLTYYHPTGPVGQVFETMAGDPRRREVALVGLGVGSLAAYGAADETFTFYEIDPTVERLARDLELFTFLADSRAEVRVVLGDARLRLADAPDGAFGILVLDAFSSDAIPVHLLTREAFELYLSKLSEDGLIVLHISNRYLDLEPVVANLAASLGLVAFVQDDAPTDEEAAIGKTSSVWALLARDVRWIPQTRFWQTAQPDGRGKVWTDDFSNILGAFRLDR
jgi:hypothetical protein